MYESDSYNDYVRAVYMTEPVMLRSGITFDDISSQDASFILNYVCMVSSRELVMLVYTAPGSAKTRSCSSCSAAAATPGWTLTLGLGS